MNQSNSKQDYNFEKQYINVIELKSEIQKAIELNVASLSTYLSPKAVESTNHIEQLVSTIEKNKSSIHSNIITICKHFSEKMTNRIEVYHSLQNMYLASFQRSKLLIKGKNRYKECNLMKKSEMISIQYEISQLTHKIKLVQLESSNLDTEIANLKKENKNSYTTEISLLEQVMSFDKRLYTVFNAREGLVKQKQQIQNEINQKDFLIKKQITSQTQTKIKAITKKINDCNTVLNSISPMQKYWNIKLGEHKEMEKELSDYYRLSTSKLAQLDILAEKQCNLPSPLITKHNKVKNALYALIANAKIQYPFLFKMTPLLNDSNPCLLMKSITTIIPNMIKDKKDDLLITQRKIDISKEKIKKIQLKITQSFYKRINSRKVMIALKENVVDNVNERERILQAELIEKERQNKIAQLKQKEAQLLWELQKKEEANRINEMKKEKEKEKEKVIKKPRKRAKKKDKESESNSEEETKEKSEMRKSTMGNSNNKKPYINNDLEKIEKSFDSTYSESSLNLNNLSFIDEISKNIQEVHNFHQKNSFGDKKNKYSKYDFSYL